MARRRIQQRLLVAFLGIVVAVLAPAAIMLDAWIGDSVRALERESLTREAHALASELGRRPPVDIAAWVGELSASARVTVVDAKGRVRGDSGVSPAALSRLPSHATRPEVQAALAGEVGVAVRSSATIGATLLYVAVPVPGATPPMALRVALSLDQVGATVGRAHFAMWLAGLMALTLALLLGATLSRWLTRPILAMTQVARAMSHGDFEVVLPPPSDDELGELSHALDTLRNQLALRLAELRQEGLKLRAIVNGLSEGVALVQGDVITVANPAFARLCGRRGEIEGSGLGRVAPAIGEAIVRVRERRASGGSELQLADRALGVQIAPLGPPEASQWLVVLIDMTDQRRLERLRRELVANASHELRTPVAAIVGAAETLAAGAADDPVARRSFLEILVRHAERLSRLTADLLDIARLEAGYRPRVELVTLSPAVATVLAALESKAAAKSVTLLAAVPPELRVTAERAAVEQIVTNLVDNAIKYTPPGGQVRVSAAPVGTRVQLEVADTGPGIPRQHHARLFERFYRIDDARARELGGTGLGLAIVKHLALAHGGDVAVHSEMGQGSRFVVTLPRDGAHGGAHE